MISLKELREGLGGEYEFKGDDEQVRVLDKGGCDVAFVDLESGMVESELNVKWHDTEAGLCSGATDQAKAIVDEELRQVWEEAGFNLSESGSMSTYSYRDDSEKEYPVYQVEVTKDVGSVAEAVEAVSWIRYADDTAWM